MPVVAVSISIQHAFLLEVPNRGAQQLLDSDGYVYSHKKDKDTVLSPAWRCCKYGPPTKFPCRCYLALSDNSLSMGTKAYNHEADLQAPQRQQVCAFGVYFKW